MNDHRREFLCLLEFNMSFLVSCCLSPISRNRNVASTDNNVFSFLFTRIILGWTEETSLIGDGVIERKIERMTTDRSAPIYLLRKRSLSLYWKHGQAKESDRGRLLTSRLPQPYYLFWLFRSYIKNNQSLSEFHANGV